MATETILEPTTLAIEGMTCSSCVNAVEKALNNMEGVRATINFATETAHVMAPVDMDVKELIKTVEKAGYKASLLRDAQAVTLHSKKSARALFFAFIFFSGFNEATEHLGLQLNLLVRNLLQSGPYIFILQFFIKIKPTDYY